MENFNVQNISEFLKNAESVFQQGVLQEQYKYFEEEKAYLQILKSDEQNAAALQELAKVYYIKKQWQKALNFAQKALFLQKENIEVLVLLGNIWLKLRQYKNAEACFKIALMQQPESVSILGSVAHVSYLMGKFGVAEQYLRKSIEISPQNANTYFNLGRIFLETRKIKDARRCCEKATELKPDFAEAYASIGMIDLALKRWSEGFKNYEWRLKNPAKAARWQWCEHKPRWAGEIFSGKRLLIHDEQGVGDVLQCARYFPLVKERGGAVFLSTKDSLLRLFKENKYLDDVWVHSREVDLNSFDIYVPLMSLPMIFSTSFNTIPQAVPYITADKQLIYTWKKRFSRNCLKVGLVWKSDMFGSGRYLSRFCQLSDFLPLSKLRDVSFYSLQKNAEEDHKLAASHALHLIDYMDEVRDFSDTAAIIANLDVIVTIDTAVLHLAGAMGKKVIALIPYTCDWRWFWDDSESTPWYPHNVSLIRQSKRDDWSDVMYKVLDILTI